MRLTDNDRGFAVLLHEGYPDGEECMLVQHSSAINPAYPDSLDKPGSSCLWVRRDHHLNRAQVRELVAHLTRWLETGSMRPEGRCRVSKPTVVTLCGSTRFGDAFRDALREEALAGRIVLSAGLLGHAEGVDMDGPVKAMLDELHLRKIDLSDEVLILNVGKYVGASTARELAYARANGKRVRFLEPEGGAA